MSAAVVPRFFHKTAALVLLAHLCVVLAMAASPRLHEAIHHDCAVTLFIHGATEHVAPPVCLVAADLPCVEVLRMEAAREVSLARVEGRIRERAPPAAAV